MKKKVLINWNIVEDAIGIHQYPLNVHPKVTCSTGVSSWVLSLAAEVCSAHVPDKLEVSGGKKTTRAILINEGWELVDKYPGVLTPWQDSS